MKLVLLYGPPAVGKFTIATELQKLTGFKNFHNHAVIDVVSGIFGFDHPTHTRLEHEIRGRIVDEAAAAGIDLVVTGVVANNNKYLYQAMVDSYKNRGGEAYLVQLTAGRDVLESRVSHPSRERKINKSTELAKFMQQYPESTEKFGEGDQLVIDTSKIQSKEAAQKIAEHYKL